MDDALTVANLTQMVTTPLVISGLQLAYDLFITGYGTQQSLYDAGISVISLAVSKIISDAFNYKIVAGVDSAYLTSLSKYLTLPTINYFIYNYLTTNYFEKKYFNSNTKSSAEMIALPVALGFVSQMADDAVLSLMGF